jgi:hypothetical protein
MPRDYSNRSRPTPGTHVAAAPSLPGGPGPIPAWLEAAARPWSAASEEDVSVEQGYDWSTARRDVRFALLLRQARQQFFYRLVEQARKRMQKSEELEKLLSERAPSERGFQRDHLCILAEFFFSLRALGLDDPQAILRYVKAHNTEIEREVATNPLCRDPSGKNGLTPYGRRLRRSEFSEGEMRSIGNNYFDNGNTFCLSVSDISRLMCRLMSPDPVDRLLTALIQAGLLAKRRRGERDILVYSPEPGILEEEFGRYLQGIRAASAEAKG